MTITKSITPEAFFDSLSLGHKLDGYLDGFKLEEIFLFSYFSSILYIYAGNLLATWPHRYIVTNGYPFSEELREAVARHVQNGLFEKKGEFYTISGRGTDEFNKFKILPTLQSREKFLNAASATSILVPYSKTLRALLSEPEIKKAEELENESWLTQTEVYEKFTEISAVVGVSIKDLIIPAVTWINYLDSQNLEGV
ncbi:hypothetical protein EHQ86_18620 [Leptospira yasudae]|nr:hypothetical protein EHQ86_18620 [Leptospira yasudae]